MKTLLFFAVLVTLVIATWLFIPLLQGRDADFDTRLALLQGLGGDFVDTPSEATPTPPSQAPEAAPSRPLPGPAESVEAGGATGKAAETSIGEEPGDRPPIIEKGPTREPGRQYFPLAPPVDSENDTAATATDAVRTQQDTTLAFLIRQRLRTLGLDPGQLTLDSELGPQARAAIKKYQREHSLPVDGQASVALLDHLDRVLSGDGRTGEEDAETKVAEAPAAPPADQPGSAETDSARAESLPTPGTEPSEDSLLEHLERVFRDDAQTGEEGAATKVAEAPPAPPGGDRTGEEDAETKVAEAPPAPPADRPGPADTDSALGERLQTPGTEPSEEALSQRGAPGGGRTGEEDAATKVAEAPPAPPADRPGPADADRARGERLQTPDKGSSEEALPRSGGRYGAAPASEAVESAAPPVADATRGDESFLFLVQARLRQLGLRIERVLFGDGRTGKEDAATKVAEAPPAPPADQPGSAETDSARAERLPTPGTEPSEDPLVEQLERVLLDYARTGEEGAGAEVAEAPPAPPADRPGPADAKRARAERLPTPGTEPSEDPLVEQLERVLLDYARTGEEGAGAEVAEAPPAPPADRPGPADAKRALGERLPTPGTEPSEEALSQRPPPGGGRTGEEGAATKVAEAPPAPPADRPSPADMDSARAESLPTPGTEPSEVPLVEHLEQVLLDRARTGEEGAAPASESAQSVAPPVADATRGDESLIFLVQARLRQLGLHPGPMTLTTEPGPQARAAIMEYQREHSLPVDGQVSVALLDHLERVLLDQGQIIEGRAAKKVAEAPPAPAADRPGPADTEEARAEEWQRPGAASSGDPVVARGRPGRGRTGEEGAEAGRSSKPAARVGGYEYFRKGFEAAKDGRQDLAIDYYTRAIESGDLSQQHLASTFSNRGVIYWAIGLFDRAIEDFDEAVRLKPDYAQAYHNRGIAYHDKGLDKRAIADLDNAIRLEPDYATAYFNRGLAYDRMGLYNRASDDYSKAIQLQPDLDSAYFNRGRMHEAKGRRPSALQDFQRAYSLDPGDPDYRAKMKELGLLK